jgi:Ca2+-binding EF-hand superfamily protein
VERVDIPAGMIPLETEPIPGKKKIPFYAKLRAEAERSLLRDGKGTLYFGFFLDPLYNIHWNNEVAPVRFELEVPEGVTAHPMKGEGPTLEVKADADPREFLIEVTDAGDTNATLRVNVHYFACDDAETYCVPVTQHYDVHLQRDRDGGRRMTGRGGPGGEGTRNPRERLLEYDANGDGEISREELPERMRRVFDRLDANRDGSLDEDELRRGMRGRPRDPARMVERLMQMDDDGDGRLSREEAPERMGLMFERMDANGDGLIDRKEIEAVRELFRRRPPPR